MSARGSCRIGTRTSWRKQLARRGDEQAAVVWVEDSATGEGFIAWAHVEPAESDTLVENGQEVPRGVAIDRIKRNPDWPRGQTIGLSEAGELIRRHREYFVMVIR